jgi:hypothetical protein
MKHLWIFLLAFGICCLISGFIGGYVAGRHDQKIVDAGQIDSLKMDTTDNVNVINFLENPKQKDTVFLAKMALNR